MRLSETSACNNCTIIIVTQIQFLHNFPNKKQIEALIHSQMAQNMLENRCILARLSNFNALKYNIFSKKCSVVSPASLCNYGEFFSNILARKLIAEVFMSPVSRSRRDVAQDQTIYLSTLDQNILFPKYSMHGYMSV